MSKQISIHERQQMIASMASRGKILDKSQLMLELGEEFTASNRAAAYAAFEGLVERGVMVRTASEGYAVSDTVAMVAL